MQSYFSHLFTYHDWAHRRVLQALADLDDTAEVRWLYTHLILSQHRWLERVRGEDTRGRPWFHTDDAYDLARCAREWEASLNTWLDFLATASNEEMSRTVTYTSSEGPSYQSTVQEIAFQLLNHSTHHRAQIVRILREQGHPPPATDYIFFSRRMA